MWGTDELIKKEGRSSSFRLRPFALKGEQNYRPPPGRGPFPIRDIRHNNSPNMPS
jgi:hypothetical protein